MTIQLFDSFTDTNGVQLDAHDADINLPGTAWVNLIGAGGTFTIFNNRATVQDVNVRTLCAHDTGVADFIFTFEVDMTLGVEAAVYFRVKDADDWWVLELNNSAVTWRLMKSVAGVETVEDSGAATFGSVVQYRVTCDGSSIVVEDLTNTNSLSANDSTHETETLVGLGEAITSTSVPLAFDNFLVTVPTVAGSDVQIEVVAFNPPAAIGTQDITHPNLTGITPKGAVFFTTLGNPDSLSDSAQFCVGVATGPNNRWCWLNSFPDGTNGFGGGAHGFDQTKPIVLPLVPDGSGGSEGAADFVGFIDGGLRLDWVVGFGTGTYVPGTGVNQRTIIAIIFAGDDVECFATVHDLQPNPLVITVPFEADGAMACIPDTSTSPQDYNESPRGGFGWQDMDFTTPGFANIAALALRRQTLGPLSQEAMARLDTETASNIGPTGATLQCVRYTDPTPNSITARFDSGGGPLKCGAFFFQANGVSVKVGNIFGPSLPGPIGETDPGFRPQFVHLILSSLDAIEGLGAVDLVWGVGAFTDDDQKANWQYSEDASSAPVAASGHRNPTVAFMRDESVPQDVVDGDFISFGDQGWTYLFEGAPKAASGQGLPQSWGYLAIGQAEPAAVVEDVVCRPNPWTS